MRLHKVVEGYLTYKTSLGMRFKNEGFALRAFCKAMGDIELGHIDPSAVLAFIGDSRKPGRWRCYYRIFKSFYRYALERGFVRTSPLSGRPPRFPAQTPPYIYSTDELQRLFAAASALPTVYSPLQPLTYRTLLMLLYGAGLRVGEAISLQLRDVDLPSRILTIRQTKFFKDRLVPVGPKLGRILARYCEQRCRLPKPYGEESAFFCNRTGRKLDHTRALVIFRRLRSQANIHRSGGVRAQPRLHDMRHTCATDHLVAWYRNDQDVQRLLPHLSTYLGHKGVESTQCYLSLTPELLKHASDRFHRYFKQGDRHV